MDVTFLWVCISGRMLYRFGAFCVLRLANSITCYECVSAVLHTTCNTGTEPTLPELLRFTCVDGRVINIPVEIAIKYVKFGTFLLDDRNGSRVKIMARKHLNDAEEINTDPPGMADWKRQAASDLGNTC